MVALRAWRIPVWRWVGVGGYGFVGLVMVGAFLRKGRARDASLARAAAFTPSRSQAVTVITSFAKAVTIRKNI